MTIVVQDSFTNIDNTLLSNHTTDTGHSWAVAGAGTAIIKNNQATVSSNGDNFATVDVGLSDAIVSVTLSLKHGWSKLIWRFTNSSNYYRWENGNIYKKAGGSQSTLASTNYASDGDVLSVRIEGNVHTFYINGVEQATFTDTFNQTVAKHGIGLASTTGYFDDFKLESLGTATDITVTSVVATNTASMTAPSVTTASNTAVNAVVSQSTVSAISPAVGSNTNITVNSVTTTISTDAVSPSIDAQKQVTVLANVASVDVTALIPSVGSSGNVTVNLITATVNTQAIAPNISAESPNVSISAVAATVSTGADSPAVGVDSNVNIVSVAVNATTAAVSPTVGLTNGINIVSPVGSLNVSMISPLISTDSLITVAQAELQIDAFSPTINGSIIIGTIELKGKRELYVYLVGKQELYIPLKGGVGMTINNPTVSMIAGDSKYLSVTVDGLTDFTGCTFKWGLRQRNGENIITKTSASGISIVDGKVQIKLDPADTEALKGVYYHECEMTDTLGNVSTIFTGLVSVSKSSV